MQLSVERRIDDGGAVSSASELASRRTDMAISQAVSALDTPDSEEVVHNQHS